MDHLMRVLILSLKLSSFLQLFFSSTSFLSSSLLKFWCSPSVPLSSPFSLLTPHSSFGHTTTCVPSTNAYVPFYPTHIGSSLLIYKPEYLAYKKTSPLTCPTTSHIQYIQTWSNYLPIVKHALLPTFFFYLANNSVTNLEISLSFPTWN